MSETVLVYRSCRQDMTSYRRFRWPKSGPVEAPDWDPKPECGSGLHGLRVGDQEPGEWYGNDCVLVVRVPVVEMVDRIGKVKFRRGEVVHCGDIVSASDYLARNGGAEGMHRRHATALDGCTLTAGDFSELTAAGKRAKLTAGIFSTLTAWDESTLTAGDGSTLTAGNSSTLAAGLLSTLTAGNYSTLKAGNNSTLIGRWRDGCRYRVAVAYVGEDGIKADTPYWFADGKFEEITK